MLDLEKINQLEHSAILRELSQKVFDLMQKNPEKLYYHLYRVDIDDHYLDLMKQKYKKSEELADQLAIIILDRTLKKIETQRKFKD